MSALAAVRGRSGQAESFVTELLAHAGITIGGDKPWDLVVNDERFFQRVIRDRELGVGESYQEGWWDTESMDELLARIIEADLQSQVKPSLTHLSMFLGAHLRNRQSIARAKRNAGAHYNIGNDLYERMLDKRMIYSCAYWDSAEDLDSAQEAKLRLIAEKLHLEPGMRVLDIGCGWGGFAQFVAEEYGVSVTGISPAANQVEVAAERTAGLDVTIRQADYRQISGTFDRIVSIGMLEHVGPSNYKTFFKVNRELLADDGIILHHTIGSRASITHVDPWFDRYIFPGGVLPSIAQMAKATEPHWALEDVHNFGVDYDTTLMAWHRNIEEAWDDLPAYDEHFRRTWRYYLLGSAAAFRARGIQLWQLVWRPAPRRMPMYRAVR